MNLIFDLDGTLIDSAPDVCNSLNYALKATGYGCLPDNTIKGFIGRGADFLVSNALDCLGHEKQIDEVNIIKNLFIQTYVANPVLKTTIFPGAKKTLQHCQDNKIQIALCTNKPKKTTLAVLEALNLRNFFSKICCGDEVPYPKPDGRHIKTTAKGFKNTKNLMIMVGDSENDICAAKSAGIPSIFVTFGYGKKVDLCSTPTASINSFDEFADAIKFVKNECAQHD